MNSLSLMIYLADVVPSFGGMLAFTASVLLLAGLTMGLGALCLDEVAERREGIKWLLAPALVLGLVACAVPSKQTLYMIAASEMGQRVYETPATQEMLGDLHEVLKGKLKELKKEGAK